MALDVGDAFLGSPYFTLKQGAVEMEVLQRLGYSAMALGNHDFDGGDGLPHLFRQRARYAPAVPVLCCNVRQADGALACSKKAGC